VSYLVERSEAAESFKGSDSNGHFGFVIVVGIILWVFSVELLGKFLVGMSLNGQCFGDGEDFEEER